MPYHLYTDGSHSQQLSIAGIGGYLLDERKKQVWSFSLPIHEDMQQHELLALEYGLNQCIADGIKEVACHTDSQTVALDLSVGRRKIQDKPSTRIFNRILSLCENFDTITFTYIPRRRNKIADKLSKEQLVQATSSSTRIQLTQLAHENYFHSPNFYCIEQFKSREEYIQIKEQLSQYYVFEMYRTQGDSCIEVYLTEKTYQAKSTHIHSYICRDRLDLLAIIAKTLKETTFDHIGILISPSNNAIEPILRGMKPIDEDIQLAMEYFKGAISHLKGVYIDSNGWAYDALSTPKMKPQIKFLVDALRTLGGTYHIGESYKIENYFTLPKAKRKDTIEIQKRYLQEMKQIFPSISNIKEELIKDGIIFRF